MKAEEMNINLLFRNSSKNLFFSIELLESAVSCRRSNILSAGRAVTSSLPPNNRHRHSKVDLLKHSRVCKSLQCSFLFRRLQVHTSPHAITLPPNSAHAKRIILKVMSTWSTSVEVRNILSNNQAEIQFIYEYHCV